MRCKKVGSTTCLWRFYEEKKNSNKYHSKSNNQSKAFNSNNATYKVIGSPIAE
ncbi:hypothetical protein HanRHA438_Chr09g0418371 [Helianthus annuus]|nr:hypothetical protein HanRHA438_Chr09g0418371 [Helianthus annuus]